MSRPQNIITVPGKTADSTAPTLEQLVKASNGVVRFKIQKTTKTDPIREYIAFSKKDDAGDFASLIKAPKPFALPGENGWCVLYYGPKTEAPDSSHKTANKVFNLARTLKKPTELYPLENDDVTEVNFPDILRGLLNAHKLVKGQQTVQISASGNGSNGRTVLAAEKLRALLGGSTIFLELTTNAILARLTDFNPATARELPALRSLTEELGVTFTVNERNHIVFNGPKEAQTKLVTALSEMRAPIQRKTGEQRKER